MLISNLGIEGKRLQLEWQNIQSHLLPPLHARQRAIVYMLPHDAFASPRLASPLDIWLYEFRYLARRHHAK